MSEIPEDVAAAARGAIDRMPELKAMIDPGEFWELVQHEVETAIIAERTRALSQLEAGKVKPEQIEAAMKVSETFDLFQRRNGTYHRCSLSNDEITAICAALAIPTPAPEAEPVGLPRGFTRPVLTDMLDIMKDEEQTVDGGFGPQESTAGFFTRLLRTLLEATPTPAVDADAVIEAARKAGDAAWEQWSGGRSPLDGMEFIASAIVRALSLPPSADKGE